MNVLILDDEPPARRSLKHALADIGVTEVREAGSIEQAVKAITEQRPDVMFLDVELRGGKQGDLPSKKRGGAFLLIGFMALGGFVVQRGFIAEGRV